MARDWYGDAPRRKSYAELVEMEIRRYDQQARRDADRRRMMGGGEYDEYYPGLTDEDAEAVQRQGARDTLIGVPEAALTVGSSILADIPAGWAGLSAVGEETERQPDGTNAPAATQYNAADRVEQVQDALTYRPRTEEGQRVLQGLGTAIEFIMSPFRRGADATLSAAQEADAIPAATIPLTILTAAGEAIPGRRATSGATRAATNYAQSAEELAELLAVAEKYDPNVTRAVNAAESGQPIPPADPALVDRQPSGNALESDADVQARMDEPIGRRSTDVAANEDIPLGQTQAFRSQRGSVEDTGAGAQVLATQAGRNVVTNAMNMDESRVAQRYPTAVAATENALNDPTLQVDIESMSPAQAERAMEAMRQYPQYRNLDADPYVAAGQVTNLHRNNLEWLMENVPKEILERSSQWYEGAQRIAFDLGDTYRFSPEQAAGVLAVMSPKTEWFTNVSSAERIMDIVAQGDNLRWSREMTEAFDRFSGNINDKKFADALESVRGRNYADLETPQEKALFIRAYDEAHNPRGFATVTPEGGRAGNVLNQSGTEARFGGWGVGMGPIAKAVEILESGDLALISERLGTNHKIRNFYNNIIAPHSRQGDVTIDTHAVSANMLSPYGQSSTPVAHAFGSTTPGTPGAGGSAITGIQGTYPIHAEPYRELGNAMNVPPRAVQSMTWEAVRGLFTNKTPKIKAAAEQIWTQYSRGLISEGEARQKIMELAGGIDLPAWAR